MIGMEGRVRLGLFKGADGNAKEDKSNHISEYSTWDHVNLHYLDSNLIQNLL